MSLGQVQSVLICSSTGVNDNTGACPNGMNRLKAVDAYVLVPSASTYIDNIEQPIDYILLGQYFAFGFSAIIVFWALGKGIGAVFSVLR